MGTKGERQAARERVSAYHQAELAELLTNVVAAVDRYRAGEVDACTLDETIHHCHRAAGNSGNSASPAVAVATLSSSATSSTGWPPTRKPSTGGNALRRDGAGEPHLSPPWSGFLLVRLSLTVGTRHHG
jgi:hypothetical protein